mmetsp:Transcript_113296/g.360125  ORF Transcript_113296/g.360125 Transcript_113296/m.360125 type:complete len:258 (-) Transcript_113296:704-1477(-)
MAGTSMVSTTPANSTAFTEAFFSAWTKASTASVDACGVEMRSREERVSGASGLRATSCTAGGISVKRGWTSSSSPSATPASTNGVATLSRQLLIAPSSAGCSKTSVATSCGDAFSNISVDVNGVATLSLQDRVPDTGVMGSSEMASEMETPFGSSASPSPSTRRPRSSWRICVMLLRMASSSVDSWRSRLASPSEASSSDSSSFCSSRCARWLQTQQAKRSRDSMDIFSCFTVRRNFSFSGSTVGVVRRTFKSASML